MKKSFMTRILATGLSLAMAFSMAAATNVTTASAASKPAMITSAGASAKSLSLKVGEVTKIKVNAATKANYKVSAVKASSKRVRAAVVGSTVVAIRGLKATVEGKPSTVKVSFKSRKTNKTSKFTYSSKVTVIEDKLSVAGVVATNGTTLTVTGTKLGDLTATDVTVEGNVVSSYTAAADGKTATIALVAALVPGSTTNVTINGTTYAVKYEAVKAAAVELTTTTFDDNTPNQQMKLKVNGAEMSVQELNVNGYDVRFYAYQSSSTSSTPTSAAVFKSTTGTPAYSVDGVVTSGPIGLGSYYVKAVVKKGAEYLESALTEIVFVDLDTQTTGINKVVFKDTSAKYIAESTGSLKLVQNEEPTISEVNITNAGKKYSIKSFTANNMSLKSSDSTVLAVTAYNKVKANKAGTATLTVTYGKQTLAISVTIDQTARAFSTIVADGGNASSLVVNENKDLVFYAIDNHGAIMTDSTNIGIYALSVDKNVIAVSGSAATTPAFAKNAGSAVDGTSGKAVFTVSGAGVGSTSITLFQAAKNASPKFTDKVDGSLSKLTADLTVGAADTTSYGLNSYVIDRQRFLQNKDVYTLNKNTLDARSQKMVLKLTKYQRGVESVKSVTFGAINPGKILLTGDSVSVCTASAVSPSLTTGTALSSGTSMVGDDTEYLVVEAKKAGTTVIEVEYTLGGIRYTAKQTITVTDTTPVVGAITPKKATFGDSDVTFKLGDVFDLEYVDGKTYKLKSPVTYSANSTPLQVYYTTADIKKNIDSVEETLVKANHFYIYAPGVQDDSAKYYDLGIMMARVADTDTVVTSLGTVGTDTNTLVHNSSYAIQGSDHGKVNLYLDNDGTIDSTSNCIAVVTIE